MRSKLLIVLAGLLAAGGGYWAYHHRSGAGDSGGIAQLPAAIEMKDLDGQPRRLEDWRGKLLLVNFWATWCGPCLHEIPVLIKMQQQYGARGLQIIGPAVDDPDAVRGMVGTLGFDYPILVTGSPEGMIKAMESLNNTLGALPFSLLVAPDGHIIKRQLGEFSAAELTSLIEAHLPS